MKKTAITTALAAVLLASVSTAALAQEPDHQHDGGRPQGGGEHPRNDAPPGATFGRGGMTPGVQHAPPPQAQPQQQAAPRPAAAPAAQAQPQQQQRGPGGDRHDRGGFNGQPGGPPQGAAQAPQGGGNRGYGGDQRGPGDRGDNRGDNRGDPRNYQGGPPRGGPGYQGDRGDRGPGDRGDRGDYGRGPGGPGPGQGWDPRRGGRPPQWDHNRYPPVYASSQRYRADRYRAPYGFFVRSWGYGDILPRGWYGDNYRLNNFWDYDLPYPPPGYEWVRVGSDALLIDGYSGRVVQVVRYLFW